MAESEVFPVPMDDRSWEDLVQAGNYADVRYVWEGKFKTEPRSICMAEMKVVSFDESLTLKDLVKKLDQMGYRPANARELFSFVDYHRDRAMQQDLLIAAGALCRCDEEGNLAALCVSCWDKMSLGVGVDCFGFKGSWEAGVYFLAVRKPALTFWQLAGIKLFGSRC